MEARIVRDNLSKCQKVEGVNNYERCKDLAERYADMLKESRVRVSSSFVPLASHVGFGSRIAYFCVDVCSQFWLFIGQGLQGD